MNKLRHFYHKLHHIQVNWNFFLILGLSSILAVTLSLASSKAQTASSVQIGWEFSGTSELNKASITETKFIGQCSGISSDSLSARFISSKTPPAPTRRVVVKNITRGLDSNPYPYTDREYNRSRSSEGTQMAFGTRHEEKNLTVIEGENIFEYDIKENKNVIDSGQFTAFINKVVQIKARNAVPSTQRKCVHYNKKGHCTDYISQTIYTCRNS